MQVSPLRTGRRTRTPAAKDVEGTYDRDARVKFEDRFIGTVDHIISGGGQTPKELRELAQAAKVVLDARRSEDVAEESEEKTNQTMVPMEHMGGYGL
jgi:hypothetical protein